MDRINRWVIGSIPYTILLSFVLLKWFSTSYYFVLGAVSSVLFIANFVYNRKFVIHNYTYLILLFGIYVIFSNVFIAKNKFILYNELFKNQFLYIFFVLNIIENTVFTRKQVTRWFRVFEITIWATLIVILVQQFYDRDFFQNKTQMDVNFDRSLVSQSEIRLISIYSWSGLLDIILYFIPIIFFMINYELNRNNIFRALLFAFILIAVVILNKARTSMMPAVLVLFIIRSSYHRKNTDVIMNRIIIIFFILFSIYTAFTNIPFLNNILRDRILETSKANTEARTMNTRILAFQAFVKCFPDAPILGAGNTKYSSGSKGEWNYKLSTILAGRSAQIHVGLIDIFYLYGLAGGLIYFSFYYLALKKVYKKSKQYNFRAVFWGLMVLPVTNIGVVTFNIMSAGLLLAFVLSRNLEVFCKKPEVRMKVNVPAESSLRPVEFNSTTPVIAGN